MFHYPVSDSIELRLLQTHHAEALFALIDRNRAHISTWLVWVEGTQAVADTRSFIQHSLQQFADNNGAAFGIFYHGEIAGTISFHFFDWHDRRTEIGYWLGAEFGRRGIMTACARALTTYALRELQLNRVEIWAAEGNTKSRAIPERLGYTHDGTLRRRFRKDDVYLNMVIYGMLAEEWTT